MNDRLNASRGSPSGDLTEAAFGAEGVVISPERVGLSRVAVVSPGWIGLRAQRGEGLSIAMPRG